VYPGTSVLEHDDRLWLYYSGAERRHGQGAGQTGIGLATLPAERLVAMAAARDGEPGIVETPPLLLPEGELVVNADLGGGSLRIELVDGAGVALPGYERGACRLVPVDELRSAVRWGHGGPRPFPREQPVKLRFVLQGARLFGFRISAVTRHDFQPVE
jgi:hypothetical protein